MILIKSQLDLKQFCHIQLAITSANNIIVGNNISLSGNNICHTELAITSAKYNLKAKVAITSATIMAITSAISLNQHTIGNNISLSGITSATYHWP